MDLACMKEKVYLKLPCTNSTDTGGLKASKIYLKLWGKLGCSPQYTQDGTCLAPKPCSIAMVMGNYPTVGVPGAAPSTLTRHHHLSHPLCRVQPQRYV